MRMINIHTYQINILNLYGYICEYVYSRLYAYIQLGFMIMNICKYIYIETTQHFAFRNKHRRYVSLIHFTILKIISFGFWSYKYVV